MSRPSERLHRNWYSQHSDDLIEIRVEVRDDRSLVDAVCPFFDVVAVVFDNDISDSPSA